MASKERESSAQSLRLPKIQNQALLSGLAYCISSCSMILVNKLFYLSMVSVLQYFLCYTRYILLPLTIYFPILMQHSCVPSLKHLFHDLLLQNIVSVTIVSTLSLSGAVPTEPLTWNLIKVWFLLISFFTVCWSQACLGMWQIFSISLVLVLFAVLFFRSMHRSMKLFSQL
jgi:GDP-mannose transporter